MAIGGGFLGAIKGGEKVSAEKQAFRARVEARANNHQHKVAKVFNDGQITGVQQGYQVGRSDGEQAGFQKGQEYVIQQLQEHVAAQQAAEQPGKFASAVGQRGASAGDAVLKDRETAATNGAQIG